MKQLTYFLYLILNNVLIIRPLNNYTFTNAMGYSGDCIEVRLYYE